MAYERESGHLSHFIPNIPLATTTAGVMREMDIGAASADHGEYICIRPCVVKKLGFIVAGEAIGGTSTDPQVVFKKRPTPLDATDESAVGTLTLPDTTAVGKVVYKDITPVEFAVGDSMEIAHVIGTGTPTGMGLPFFVCADSPEAAGNNTDMVASA